MIETYKDFEIYQEDDTRSVYYVALSPTYNPSYEGPEDGWDLGGVSLQGSTLEEIKREIDDYDHSINN